MGERLTPDAPHLGKRRPPWAPSCRPTARKVSSQERALRGWRRVSEARTPRTRSQWLVGLGFGTGFTN